MIGQPPGPYDFGTNSCLTYGGDVLRAGGLNVPANTTDLPSGSPVRNGNMSLREQLISILQDKYMAIGAVPNVAEAIAADARFNIWVLTHAKKQANETRMMELLEHYDELVERCSFVARTFNEHHNLAELVAGIDALTKALTEAAKSL
jgi:hypothetical protein